MRDFEVRMARAWRPARRYAALIAAAMAARDGGSFGEGAKAIRAPLAARGRSASRASGTPVGSASEARLARRRWFVLGRLMEALIVADAGAAHWLSRHLAGAACREDERALLAPLITVKE